MIYVVASEGNGMFFNSKMLQLYYVWEIGLEHNQK